MSDAPCPMPDALIDQHLYIHAEPDIAAAMRMVRRGAEQTGFGPVDASYLTTAAAELASNLWLHAGGGVFSVWRDPLLPGIVIETRDSGPGIADIPLALEDGYSTAGGLGCGLPGVRRLMDGLEIDSRPGGGTHIRAWKVRRRDHL